jgi:hypothetical protein
MESFSIVKGARFLNLSQKVFHTIVHSGQSEIVEVIELTKKV